MRIFERWYFGLCSNLRFSYYRVIIISWRIFKFLLEDFHNSFFWFKVLFKCKNGKATIVWHTTPCLLRLEGWLGLLKAHLATKWIHWNSSKCVRILSLVRSWVNLHWYHGKTLKLQLTCNHGEYIPSSY
jgi:hypothetical protein